MKVIFLIAILCNILFSDEIDLVFHEDEIEKSWYFGIGRISGEGQNHYSKAINYDLDIKNSGTILKYGYDNFFYKVELSYLNNKIKNENFKDSIIEGLDFDLIFVYPKYKFKPNFSFGLGSHKWNKYSYLDIQDKKKIESLTYNFSYGFTYQIKNIELELSYKLKKFNWEKLVHLDNNELLEQETNLKMFYYGINYRF